MFLGEAVDFSVKALKANPVRSFLTGLGMVIGTASVILVVTISLTSRDYILEQIEGVGSNMIFAYYVSDRLVLYLYLNFFLAFLRSNVQLIVTRFRLVRRFQARPSARRIRISPRRRFPMHCLDRRVVNGEPIPQRPTLFLAEAVRQRLLGVGTQVVHDQMDGLRRERRWVG